MYACFFGTTKRWQRLSNSGGVYIHPGNTFPFMVWSRRVDVVTRKAQKQKTETAEIVICLFFSLFASKNWKYIETTHGTLKEVFGRKSPFLCEHEKEEQLDLDKKRLFVLDLDKRRLFVKE